MGAILDAALRACDARCLLERALRAHPLPDTVPLYLIAAGKAALPMARALITARGESVAAGMIVAPSVEGWHEPGSPRRGAGVGVIDAYVGGHPLPTEGSVAAARRALELASAAAARDARLVVLLSGGASALLAMPASGISLEDKIATSSMLLRAGLPIAAINAVRKHLSAIKGGRLGAAARRSVTFAISDVPAPSDDPSVIGSGPAVADASTFADAQQALAAANLWDGVPASVRARLTRGQRGDAEETIKPGDPRLADAGFVLAGSRLDAMRGAAAAARARGYDVECVPYPTLGEARLAARNFLEEVRSLARDRGRPLCIVAAGETAVVVTGDGIGGRNQEFVLAGVETLPSLGPCVLASIGTDGIDGPTDAAGALADSRSGRRAAALGLDLCGALERHDSTAVFRALGDSIVRGPTATNVGDLQVLLLG